MMERNRTNMVTKKPQALILVSPIAPTTQTAPKAIVIEGFILGRTCARMAPSMSGIMINSPDRRASIPVTTSTAAIAVMPLGRSIKANYHCPYPMTI